MAQHGVVLSFRIPADLAQEVEIAASGNKSAWVVDAPIESAPKPARAKPKPNDYDWTPAAEVIVTMGAAGNEAIADELTSRGTPRQKGGLIWNKQNITDAKRIMKRDGVWDGYMQQFG